jgi:hypothetical protein
MSRESRVTTEMVPRQTITFWYRCDWCGVESPPMERGPGRGSEPKGWGLLQSRDSELPESDACQLCLQRLLALRLVVTT